MSPPLPVREPSFRGWVGVARADITPPEGIYARNWGAAKHDIAAGVHRPLTLTSLTFQAAPAAQPLVMLAADLGWWKSPGDEHFVRAGVLEALGLDPGRLMFCLSHTHSGPALNRDDAAQPGGDNIGPYLQRLRAALVHAAQQALAEARPAIVTWRYGRCDLAANRDMADPAGNRGLAGFNAELAADDTLLVGRVTNPQGQLLATLVNYACHPTALGWDNQLISPDYVGALRELVEARTTAPCAFLQGASGDLAPAEQYAPQPDIADAHGRRLGFAVLSTLEAMLPPAIQLRFEGAVESGAVLGLWRRAPVEVSSSLAAESLSCELALKPMPGATELESQLRHAPDRVTTERLRRILGLRRLLGEGATAQVHLYCWRLGDAFLVGGPGEAYSEFQQVLRQNLAPHPVVVLNGVNGYASYLLPAERYLHLSYALTVSPFQAGCLEQLTQAALAMCGRLIQ